MERLATILVDRDTMVPGAEGVGLAESLGARPGPSIGVDQESEVEKVFTDAVRAEIALVRERHSGDWVCQTVRGYQLDAINSFSDVLDLFQHREGNLRMYAAELAGRYGASASEKGQAQLRDRLDHLLGDNTQSSGMYGGAQCEDDEADTVARMARRALRCLDCAVSPRKLSPMSHGICEPDRSGL